MFFLIVAIIFIFQILLLTICVCWLLDFNIKILILADALESYNYWLSTKANSIKDIFSDIKLLIEKFQNKLIQKKKKFILLQIISILEWLLILFIKNKHKKFLFGYKVAKILSSELSMFKNMV